MMYVCLVLVEGMTALYPIGDLRNLGLIPYAAR